VVACRRTTHHVSSLLSRMSHQILSQCTVNLSNDILVDARCDMMVGRHAFSTQGHQSSTPNRNSTFKKSDDNTTTVKRLSESILAGHIQEHILSSDATKAIKEWDITVKDGRSPVWRWIEDGLIGSWQNMIASFVSTRVDLSFDVDEWLEGARDAFWAVHRFGNTTEYQLLQPMMSDALYAASKGIFEGFAHKGLKYVPVDIGEDIDARICGIQFFSGRDMKQYTTATNTADAHHETEDEASSDSTTSQSSDDSISGKWMVISVEFKAPCSVDIVKKADGEHVSNVVDASPKMYRFFTGPLPDQLPAQQLDTPWKLLSYV
jgi:hypothetical protein